MLQNRVFVKQQPGTVTIMTLAAVIRAGALAAVFLSGCRFLFWPYAGLILVFR